MGNLETTENILPSEEKKSEQSTDRLGFLNNEKFADIKEPLTKTITDLANEQIIPEEDFWNNIQNTTEQIFSDPLYDFDPKQKSTDAQKISLFRTIFQKIKEHKKDLKSKEQKKEVIINGEKEEIINIKLRLDLETKYTQIDDKYKIYTTSDEFKQLKKNTPNINEIPEEKQDLYVSYLYASKQIIAEAKDKKISKENYKFVEGFISLNKELGVESGISLDGLSYDEIDEDVVEKKSDNTKRSMEDIVHNENLGENLVEYNADIEDFVLDEETNTINSEKMNTNGDVQNIIGDKLSDWYQEDIQKGINKLLRKNKLDKYEANFDEAGNIIDEDKIPEEDVAKLKKIQEAITQHFSNKATEKITEDTNKVIKMKTVGALLQNIGQYFKIDNLAQDFNVDLESGIEFDGKEMKLSGSMEGREMSFYYDMNSGEIFANDFVHYNQEDKTFYIDRGNKDNKGREKLPLKMPTLKTVLDESQKKHIQAMSDALEQSDSLKEYEKNLNETSFTIDTKSNVADIVIEHSMAKNIATQEAQDFLEEYIPTKNKYSHDKESQEYNLYKIVDTSFDRYTADEIKTRRNLLTRFNAKINAANPSFKDNMIQGMFSEENKEEDTNGRYDTSKGPNMYQFLRAITYEQPGTTKNDVMDLNFLEQIVVELESNDGTTKNLKNKSPKYKKLRADWESKQENLSADKIDFDKVYEN
ncbi:MAG: hypothetical protein WC010_00035 [Candidatus Absconditabacterales bacterium]